MSLISWKLYWLVIGLASLALFTWPAFAIKEAEDVEGNYEELARDQLREVIKLQSGFREIQTTVGQYKNNMNPELSMESVKSMQKKNEWPVFGIFNMKLGEALKIFLSLQQVVSKDYCNFKGFEILAKNFALNPEAGQLTFTTSMLHYYARQHAIECLPRYKDKFDWDSNSIGILKLLRQLNRYFEDLELADFTPELPEVPLKEGAPVMPFVDAKLRSFDIRASGLMKILASMGFSLDQSEPQAVRTIIEGNLLMQCSTYVELIRDIFAPAKIDLFMFRIGSQVPAPKFSDNFLEAWKSYRICLYLARADRKDMVGRFVKALEIKADL